MQGVLREIPSTDWITLVLLFSLLLLVLAKNIFSSRFFNFIALPFNTKYIFVYSKKRRLLSGFQLFSTLFQLINTSLFLYFILDILFPEKAYDTPLVFLIIFSGFLLFMILKIGLQLANGYLFQSQHQIADFVFKKLSYFNYGSLALFICNLFLAYVWPGALWVVILGLGLLILINIVGWVTLIKNHQNYFSAHLFYFILYLCALEIAPIVIISKLVNA